MRELQKLEQVQQERRQLVSRDLLKSPPLPYILIGLTMLAYVVIGWQWF